MVMFLEPKGGLTALGLVLCENSNQIFAFVFFLRLFH